mmetsp:Transcript_16340/g.31884  ORF Transcript_16340/g.31884 Transcript_16340/m.31884 type:complete len:211 (+) Transcript_16340:258-890(+)
MTQKQHCGQTNRHPSQSLPKSIEEKRHDLLSNLSRLSNNHGSRRSATLRSHPLDLIHNIQTIHNLSKDDVSTIEPRAVDGANEELRSVGVGPGVGHGEDSFALVLEIKVLVGELLPINGLSTSSIMVGEISSLAHETGDDTVERASGVSESLLASAKSAEVLCCLGSDIGTELESDTADVFSSYLHIEVDFGVCHQVNGTRECSSSMTKR